MYRPLDTVLDALKERLHCSEDKCLARRLGVSQSRLSHYRRGYQEPSIVVLDDMARLLDVEPDDLIGYLRDGDWEGLVSKARTRGMCRAQGGAHLN